MKNALEAGAIRAAHAGAPALVETANQSPAPGLDLTERELGVLALRNRLIP